MIKEAISMKLQKKCRDQLQYIQCTVFRRLDFSQNIVVHFSLLALLKFSHAKKHRSNKHTSFLETLNDLCCVKLIVKTTLCFFVELFQTSLDKMACKFVCYLFIAFKYFSVMLTKMAQKLLDIV